MHQPKKRFGQHFLHDRNIALRISESLTLAGKEYEKLLEVGPGLGVLTQYLYPVFKENLHLVEIDSDLIPALKKNYPGIADHIIQQDFLELDMGSVFSEQFGLIGNFPYNISSQILFKTVENRRLIPEMAGMFQREVAQRVVAQPGNKIYGLISAWVQTFYTVEYLFTVNEGAFNPPPKVKSGVIKLVRKNEPEDFDPKLLLQVIKAAFNQRRKTLKNALRTYEKAYTYINKEILDKRAEQLGWQEFVSLAKIIAGANSGTL